jgi:hypothetical protein
LSILLCLSTASILCANHPPDAIIESFESQSFSALPWQMGGAMPWSIYGTSPYSGSFSAASGSIGNYEKSQIKIFLNFSTGGTLRFARRVSSEANYDFLRFYIDGVEQGRWSGEVSWGEDSFEIPTGFHLLTWSYEKDGGISAGEDRAWVDDIELPPFSIAVSMVTERQNAQAPKVALYPNPMRGQAMLHFDLEHKIEAQLSLFDETGIYLGLLLRKCVFLPGRQEVPIDLKGHPSGVYWIVLGLGAEQMALRVVLSD